MGSYQFFMARRDELFTGITVEGTQIFTFKDVT